MTTLAGTARTEGIGLFTGTPVVCTIEPGTDGIRFVRDDLGVEIPVRVECLCSAPLPPALAASPRNTTLGAGGAVVTTTEHVLSALIGLGITDAIIRLNAPEPPIGDGSAAHFAEAIREAGVRASDRAVDPIRPRETVVVEDGSGGSITAEPAGAPLYRYELDYGDGPIRPQSAEWDGGVESYARDVAPARTFCLESEALAMRKLGLFALFTPRDLLVVGTDGPIDNEWRFTNEAARHKLLDLIGDLALAGRPICARITARRSGHALNHELARKLAEIA